MKNLAKIVRETIPNGRILLLTNRKALCLQQRMLANVNSNRPRLGTDCLSGNPIWDNIDIISYQEANSYITHDWFNTLQQIRVVVCDEAHFFCSDSTFNSHTSEILRLILNNFFLQQRIYLTATPEDVESIISFEEKNRLSFYIYQLELTQQMKSQELQRQHQKQKDSIQSYGGNMQVLIARQQKELDALGMENILLNNRINRISASQYLWFYEFPDDFSHVQLHFVYEWDSIIHAIKENDSEDKWLIFVRTKEKGQELKGKLGACADFFDADSKGDDKKALKDLIRREYFEKDVLIATTLLYNGVNFKDECLKHIIVDTVNRIELVQMLGRKRLSENEIINLYVMVPKENELATYLNLTRRKLKMAKSFQRDPHGFFRDNWESGNIDDNIQKLFGVPDDFLGYSLSMSYYAPYELGLEEGRLESSLDEIKRGNHLFENRVCGWLNMKYSPEMKYDASLEDLKENIKPDLIACFEKHKKMSPFPSDVGQTFCKEILDIVTPINSSLGFDFKHLHSDGESRWKADINGISKEFGLLYEVTGGKKKGFTVTSETPLSYKSRIV